MKKGFWFLIALGLFLNWSIASAQDYKVGIKEAKPFAYKEKGVWTGFSVDILEHLAMEKGFKVLYVESKTIDELLTKTKNSEVDFSIAALSITAEREKALDLSHSYFETGMGAMVRQNGSTWSTVSWVGVRVLIVLIAFTVLMYIVGMLVDKVDGDMNIKGPHEGAWWAIVTFSTTGYGDKVPTTNQGKLLAAVWMTASMFLLSIFTSYMASAWTVKRLDDTTITISDLYKTKFVVIDGSTSLRALHSIGMKYSIVDNMSDAIDLLKQNKVKAIVHDKAMLDFNARDHENYKVWSLNGNSEKYAIAFPSGSPLVEQFNVSILSEVNSVKWSSIKMKYFN